MSWPQSVRVLEVFRGDSRNVGEYPIEAFTPDVFGVPPRTAEKMQPKDIGVQVVRSHETISPDFVFPNYEDYGYGIFLLDDKSRDYVLKNIQNEKDDFLRSMMWGSLWDSVRESELDPKEYVELVLRVQSAGFSSLKVGEGRDKSRTLSTDEDETTTASLLNRVSTAMTYYLSDKQRDGIAPRLEAMLIDKMRTAPTLGQRITYYRALLNVASTE
jgi:aminopeptidase N